MQNTKQKSGTKQKLTIAAIFGAMGPGLLAALSGNDAGGIATYSSAGASYGYKMLWMLPVMTVLLIGDAGDRGALRLRHGQGAWHRSFASALACARVYLLWRRC